MEQINRAQKIIRARKSDSELSLLLESVDIIMTIQKELKLKSYITEQERVMNFFATLLYFLRKR